MRRVVSLVLALALSACGSHTVGLAPPPETTGAASASAAPPQATGKWRFNRNVDRATGQSVGKAFVETDQVTLLRGQLFAKPAFVQLQCFKDKPIIVVTFSQKVGANRSAQFSYRFNDKPPRQAKVRFHRDQMTIEIEDHASVQQFVADLHDAKKLFVSIDSLVIGPTRAIFPVESAGPAIAHGFANCLPPGNALARTARKAE